MAGMEQYLKFNKDVYINDEKIRPYLVPLEVTIGPPPAGPTTAVAQYNNPERFVYFIKSISGYVLLGSDADPLYINVKIEVTHSSQLLMPIDRPFRLAWFMQDYAGSGNRKGLELNIPQIVRPGATIMASFEALSGLSSGTKVAGILLHGIIIDKNFLELDRILRQR